MKGSFKTTAAVYKQLQYCSERFNKSLDFLINDAWSYYFSIEENLNLGYYYGVVKIKPATEEQKSPYFLATSIHGIVFQKAGDTTIQVSYDKKSSQRIRKIASVTKHRLDDILCSMLEVYGNCIYYLKKGYRPGLWRENELLWLNTGICKLFLGEKK